MHALAIESYPQMGPQTAALPLYIGDKVLHRANTFMLRVQSTILPISIRPCNYNIVMGHHVVHLCHHVHPPWTRRADLPVPLLIQLTQQPFT